IHGTALSNGQSAGVTPISLQGDRYRQSKLQEIIFFDVTCELNSPYTAKDHDAISGSGGIRSLVFQSGPGGAAKICLLISITLYCRLCGAPQAIIQICWELVWCYL